MDRFWTKVQRAGPNDCWPWQAFTDKAGYGQFRLGDKIVGAHVVAFELDRGRPARMEVQHSCDNRPCCNPAHLHEGTHASNMADCATKGRNRVPRPGNGHTKIDEKASRAIYLEVQQGNNFSRLGRRYGVTAGTIRAHYRKHADAE